MKRQAQNSFGRPFLCLGALLPSRSEREGQQRVGYDAFAKPSRKGRSLRIAAVHRVVLARPEQRDTLRQDDVDGERDRLLRRRLL